MSAHDNEPIDPYAAPRVASTPESERVRIVSMEAEHAVLVRKLRRLAFVTPAWTLAFGLTNMAFAGVAAVVFMTENGGVSWSTLALPTSWSLLGTMMMISGAQAGSGASGLLGLRKTTRAGIGAFRGGWLFWNASLGMVVCGCLAFLWSMHALTATANREPARLTADILWCAVGFVAFAAVVYAVLLLLTLPVARRMSAAGLPLYAMVDENGRVVDRLSPPGKSARVVES